MSARVCALRDMQHLHASEPYSPFVTTPWRGEEGYAYRRGILTIVCFLFVFIENEAQEMEEEGAVDESSHPRLL